jgi:hypothetical protein
MLPSWDIRLWISVHHFETRCTVSEDAVLVLLMGWFVKYIVEMASGGMIYTPSLITSSSGTRVNSTCSTPKTVGITDEGILWCTPLKWFIRREDLSRRSTISKFSLKNLYGRNLGITAGRELWSTPLKWVQGEWYTYQAPWWAVQAFK